jgi:hypothetical protein
MPILTTVLAGGSELLKKFFTAAILDEAKGGFSRTRKAWLWLRLKTTYRDREIRLSLAYLFRIKIDGKYLLVKGKRIDQYQPVGGVYKRYPPSDSVFRRLNVRDDDRLPIDDTSRDDLRVRVDGKNALALLGWFYSRVDRETSQWREFQEELVAPGILSAVNFPHVHSTHLYTIQHPLRWSPHFDRYEILVHEYYTLLPTPAQEQELRALMMHNHGTEVVWAEEHIIKALGRNNFTQTKPYSVAETAVLLISNE